MSRINISLSHIFGHDPFDQVCAAHAFEHRLITARRPQTNGMVERFTGRIADILATTRFDCLAETLPRYRKVYNQQIPQRALDHVSPIQAMKTWREKHPELFKNRVYNLAGLDI